MVSYILARTKCAELQLCQIDNIEINNDFSNKVALGNYYCEQAKVSFDNYYISDSGVEMLVYDKYVPNFECSFDLHEKGIVSGNVGFITYDELVFAGGYVNKSNNTFYLNYNNNYFWTMSPMGKNGVYAYLWRLNDANAIVGGSVSNAGSYLRPVINLKADTIVLGSGKSDDHWIVQ